MDTTGMIAHRHGDPADRNGNWGNENRGNERRVLLGLCLTSVFMVIEAVGGYLVGSLALLADAGHMLMDSAALGFAWVAFRLGRQPPDARRSYGYRRAEVLAAWVNGGALFFIAVWILVEAVERMASPIPILGAPMLGIAAAGLLINLVVLRILSRGDPENLNLRGAALHVLGDLLGSLAAIVAALVILTTGWTPIDPLLSVAVSGLILYGAWRLLRSSTHILLEGSPEGLDIDRMKRELVASVPELESIHHVHAWLLTSGRPLLTLHATLRPGAPTDAALACIKKRLRDDFHIAHSVIQIETPPCPDE